MARSKANKLDYKFVPFPVDILKSTAWVGLRNAARVAYLHIRERWCFNRQVSVSVSYKAMEHIMGRKTFSGALKQLETKGFIKKTQTGGLFRKRNYFDMSEAWRRLDREEREKKKEYNGISIKGSQMHTVENGKMTSTGSQIHTVEFMRGV